MFGPGKMAVVLNQPRTTRAFQQVLQARQPAARRRRRAIDPRRSGEPNLRRREGLLEVVGGQSDPPFGKGKPGFLIIERLIHGPVSTEGGQVLR